VSSVYLHDVLFTTNPEWFTRVERAYFAFMCRWISRADIVFTSSHSEAVRIRNNSDAGCVVPVGLGLSTELTTAAEGDDPDPALTPGHFLLTVGRLNVRKNLETTILSALNTGLVNQRCPLVVVGSPDGKTMQLGVEVREAIESGSVVFTGFVTEARLRWLYRNTALFSFLSLGEGFGMPPVEAAYFGAPVLVSDLDVFQETLGAAASYVQPTDTSAISALMAATVTSGRRQQVDARNELERRHNWETAVRAMRSAIAETVDSHNGATP
jgi:glycosyltransferase involved in cell wall biosynthesis